VSLLLACSNKNFNCGAINNNHDASNFDLGNMSWLGLSIDNTTQLSESNNMLSCHAQLKFTNPIIADNQPAPIDFDYNVYKTESATIYADYDHDYLANAVASHLDKFKFFNRISRVQKTRSKQWLYVLNESNNNYSLKLGNQTLFKAESDFTVSKIYDIDNKDTVVVYNSNNGDIYDASFDTIQIDQSGKYTTIPKQNNLGILAGFMDDEGGMFQGYVTPFMFVVGNKKNDSYCIGTCNDINEGGDPDTVIPEDQQLALKLYDQLDKAGCTTTKYPCLIKVEFKKNKVIDKIILAKKIENVQ
jgi:hypothetical protein